MDAIIAVIIPVYNVEAYLDGCLNSVLSQSLYDINVILVDDGSTDKSGLICDSYAANDSRVCVIHKINGGLSSARNAGIERVITNSNIQWVFFLDADDAIHTDTLKVLYEANISNGTKIACSMLQRIRTNQIPVSVGSPDIERMSVSRFWTKYGYESIVACGKLYSKDLFTAIRFPVGKIHEDEYVAHKLLFQENQIVVVKNPYYYYNIREGSIVNKLSREVDYEIIFAKREQLKYFLALGNKKLIRDVQIKLSKVLAQAIIAMRIFCNDERTGGLAEFKEELQCIVVTLKKDRLYHVGECQIIDQAIYPVMNKKFVWEFFRVYFLLKRAGIKNLIFKICGKLINRA